MATTDRQTERKQRRARVSLALAFAPLGMWIGAFILVGITGGFALVFATTIACVIGAVALAAIVHAVWTMGSKSVDDNSLMAVLICTMYMNGLIAIAMTFFLIILHMVRAAD